jgi:acetyl esterase/lipase
MHIIVAGDSAGGGLTLALLQVIRDADLPAQAGGVPISPWCDMTHSFPSIHMNTATDIIPQYGLSMHKPSTLWPPPSEEMTDKVHQGLKSRIRKAAGLDSSSLHRPTTKEKRPPLPNSPNPGGKDNTTKDASSPHLPHNDQEPVHLGATAPLPTATAASSPAPTDTAVPSQGPHAPTHVVRLTAQDGSELVIEDQIQLYTRNDLLTHPLVSSSMGYMGGLPPLHFVISDKEVLRDEGIYV